MNHLELYERGQIYENVAMGMLLDHGFEVSHANTEDLWLHDLDVSGIRIEVKGAQLRCISRGRSNRRTRGYQFLLHRAGKGEHSESDFHLLLCMVSAAEVFAFVIPSPALAGLSCVAIPNPVPALYQGRWKDYCEAWHLIRSAVAQKRREQTPAVAKPNTAKKAK